MAAKAKKSDEPRILFYDIETTYLQARVWRCGEQRINPSQLIEGYDQYNIICISYAWNDDKPAKVLDWGYREQNSKEMVRKFDKIIQSADVTIGKNSDRFDVKQINTQRLLHDLPPMPEWMLYTDDLEKQMRKYFYLPSQGLDYISHMLGLGGKDKMCFQDWIDIVEQKNKKSFTKMKDYCCKDVEDTRTIWNKVKHHCKPKLNFAAFANKHLACVHCGSDNVRSNGGTRYSGLTKYKQFYCKDHHGYAGRASVLKSGKFGKMK